MNTTEILTEIQKLPFAEQRHLLDVLSRNLGERQNAMTEDERLEAEVDWLLLARGIINRIPPGLTDEEEAFEPIENTGKPLSEIIIEERRWTNEK